MIGSDVLGLKQVFEKWKIGVCVDDSSEKELYQAVNAINENYEQMSNRCYDYYNSINLEKIVKEIIFE